MNEIRISEKATKKMKMSKQIFQYKYIEMAVMTMKQHCEVRGFERELTDRYTELIKTKCVGLYSKEAPNIYIKRVKLSKKFSDECAEYIKYMANKYNLSCNEFVDFCIMQFVPKF